MAKILSIGAGVMGTAITVPATKNGHDVTLIGTHLDKNIGFPVVRRKEYFAQQSVRPPKQSIT